MSKLDKRFADLETKFKYLLDENENLKERINSLELFWRFWEIAEKRKRKENHE